MISIREQRGSERIISRVVARFFSPCSPLAVQNERRGKGREEQSSEEE